MRSRKSKGPAPEGDEAQGIDRFGRRIDLSDSSVQSAEQAARRALAELTENGATFRLQARSDDLQGFVYELPAGGDRRRCREIIALAKANPAVWSAFLREIGARERRNAR